MRKNIMGAAVAATLSLMHLSATAEDMYRGSWYILPGISYMDTDSDLEANNGGGGFLKFGKELSQHWDIQAGIGYNRASEDTGIAGVGGHYKQTTLGVDALYMFSRDKFRPFLLAGLGIARNDIDYTNYPALDDRSNTTWMASVGLGAQYLFSDKFGLQADLRHQLSHSNAKALDNTLDADGAIGNTLLSLGAIYRFGEPVQVVTKDEISPVPAPAPIQVSEPEPAPVSAPLPPVTPAPEPVACNTKFDTVTIQAERLFAFDKFKLNDDAVVEVDEVIEKIKAHPEFDIVVVIGHTDRIGSQDYNQQLSEKRAEAVKQHLVLHGIDANRIRAIGKGEHQPIVECKNTKGKALIECLSPNRRVVITGERRHSLSECK